jgi:hypothetical protein
LNFPTKTNDPKSKHASDASRPNANGTRTGDGDDHPTPRDGDEWETDVRSASLRRVCGLVSQLHAILNQ